MKVFYLVFAGAVSVGLLFGTDLSRVLFNMYFLLWVPFVLLLGAALYWISRDPAKRSRTGPTIPHDETERPGSTRIEHED